MNDVLAGGKEHSRQQESEYRYPKAGAYLAYSRRKEKARVTTVE